MHMTGTGWGNWGEKISFCDDENVLKLIVVMLTEPCGYTKDTDWYT